MTHDRRLTPQRLVDALAGHVATEAAIYGDSLTFDEHVLAHEAARLLELSGWWVKREFSADLEGTGAKSKHIDLITYKVPVQSGGPSPRSVRFAFEIKLINPRRAGNLTFQTTLLLDALRLAAFAAEGSHRYCEGYQLVVASADALRHFACAKDHQADATLHGALWAAMRAAASADEWLSIARGLKGQMCKEPAHAELSERLDIALKTFRGRSYKGTDLGRVSSGVDSSLRASVTTLVDQLRSYGVTRLVTDRVYSVHVRTPSDTGVSRSGISRPDWVIWCTRACARGRG